MDGYLTTKEVAEKWNISIRQVQNLCKANKIPGIQKVGRNYLIPDTMKKPQYRLVFEETATKED